MNDKITNEYSFKYNDRKIILMTMTAAEILKEDLMTIKRKKNKSFRKE